MALALGALISAVPAYADDGVSTQSTIDSGFSFSLSMYGDTDGTDWRSKDDATATYINPRTFYGATCRVYVDGGRSSGGAYRDQGCMIGVAYLSSPGKYVIHNNVYERGNRYVQITTWAYQNYRTTITGVWSPDVTDASKYISLN